MFLLPWFFPRVKGIISMNADHVKLMLTEIICGQPPASIGGDNMYYTLHFLTARYSPAIHCAIRNDIATFLATHHHHNDRFHKVQSLCSGGHRLFLLEVLLANNW